MLQVLEMVLFRDFNYHSYKNLFVNSVCFCRRAQHFVFSFFYFRRGGRGFFLCFILFRRGGKGYLLIYLSSAMAEEYSLKSY